MGNRPNGPAEGQAGRAGSGDDDYEAQAVYWALFRGRIPPLLAQRYARAARELDRDTEPSMVAALQRLVAQDSDLEAAELAGRLTGRLALLTRKFTVMAYLAETLPDHQQYFVARRSNMPGGVVTLAWSSLLAAVKLIRGLWLLRSTQS